MEDQHQQRRPFLVPSLEPLVRQRGLMLEQSELFREQFLAFHASLQQMQGVVAQLQDDLASERAQRSQSEERGASSLASLRAELDAERRRLQSSASQSEDSVVELRSEVLLRARAADAEAQRLGGQLEVLKADLTGQLSGLGARIHELAARLPQLRDELLQEQAAELATLQTQQAALRDEIIEHFGIEERQHATVLEALEKVEGSLMTSLREECDQAFARHEALRQAGEERLLVVLDAHAVRCADDMRAEFEGLAAEVAAEASRRAHEDDLLDGRLGELHANHQSDLDLLAGELRTLQAQGAAADEASAAAVESLSAALSRAEARQAQDAAESRAQTANEAERRWAEAAGARSSLEAELSLERQQRGIMTVGLNAEVAELRAELQRETASRLEEQQSLRESTLSAALGHSLLERTGELSEHASKVHGELQLRADELRGSLLQQLRQSSDEAQLGREELWHVLASVQDKAVATSDEIHGLDSRTRSLENDLASEVSGKVEALAITNSQLSDKMSTLEQYCIDRQVTTKSLFDHYKHELDQTRVLVDSLATGRDFLESPNLDYRLYLTDQGDLAVFQSNKWGKYGGNFVGVPRWFAMGGDQPLCAVTREMRSHEKDRFLALANRTTQEESAA
eukprot:TRINITY_DN37678_c0_g1_i1.p1 TRINITY_DN37678_c0_g1~~TRINITY_DN37678_c0_g1_i1.p1  ORF type:complete len:660 (+),score=209.75 TRINITY_DN37678_c0_g1_i1:91-1980(+)